MAKLTKKVVDKVLEDFKDHLFISKALQDNEIRAFDFFDYLKKNEDSHADYLEIDKYNNIIKEAQIEEKVYSGEFSKPILLEMIKARDKKKYTYKFELEDTTPMVKLSDDEIEKRIKAFEEFRKN